jgi:hypothetical protein
MQLSAERPHPGDYERNRIVADQAERLLIDVRKPEHDELAWLGI